MRVTLIIFALIGLAVISLVVFISTGLLHLSSLDALATRTTDNPATEPDDDDPDAPTAGPADSPDATQPAFVERSVYLSAADATLTGPRIALLASDNIVLKTGDGLPPPPLPEQPELRHGGKNGAGKTPKHPRPPPPPFIARWTTPADSVEWTFEPPEAGQYRVNFVYSGPPGRGENAKEGGPFILTAGNEQIVVSLKHTTSPSSFELIDVGTLTLPRGPVQLTVRPQGKITYETVVRLRSVRLFPRGEMLNAE